MKENSIEKAIERLEKGINDTWFSTTYSQEQEEKDKKILLSDYKRVLKENEELKNKLNLKHFDINVVYNDYLEKLNEYKENSIPVQKVKDKIEEYKNMLKTCNKVKDIDRIKAINERILELEELLEGRK